MVLTGGAAEQLKRITPQGFEARVDLTLTDDFPLAAGHRHHLRRAVDKRRRDAAARAATLRELRRCR